MKLSYIATIKTNFPEADFWLTRRGSIETVGTPTDEFNKEHIGVKIEIPEIFVPRFMFYVLIVAHNEGHWKRYANGTLSLVNIKVEDVKNFWSKHI